MAYPKEIREKCGEIFAARRNRSAEELAARKANAMAKIPDLAKLERELASTSIKLSKAIIDGVDVEKKPTLARSYIGYMAQKFSLYQRLSVYDNLDFFAGVYGLFGKDKKEKIERMINVFELEKYRNTQTSLLPLGFKQRLSLSCALIHEPPILFLNEPQ